MKLSVSIYGHLIGSCTVQHAQNMRLLFLVECLLFKNLKICNFSCYGGARKIKKILSKMVPITLAVLRALNKAKMRTKIN